MATAFLGKTMRCANVAPVRGEGAPDGRRFENRMRSWISCAVDLLFRFVYLVTFGSSGEELDFSGTGWPRCRSGRARTIHWARSTDSERQTCGLTERKGTALPVRSCWCLTQVTGTSSNRFWTFRVIKSEFCGLHVLSIFDSISFQSV